MLRFLKRGPSKEERTEALLSLYLDDALTAAERAKLEARLADEPGLQERLNGLHWTVEALKSLPSVEAPRNFILSPSMVAPSEPASRPRQRRKWAAWGWATAVATMVFLFVLAGDFLFLSPALRDESLPTPTQRSLLVTGVSIAEEAEEGEAPLALEAPVTEEATEEVAESESAPSPPPEAGADGPSEKEMAPAAAVAEPSPTGARIYGTPPPPTVAVEAAVVSTPTPALIEPEEEDALPLVVSPPASVDRAEEPDEPNLAQEQAATPSGEPVGAVPLEEPPASAQGQETSEGVPLWLRLTEIGLGLLVVALAVATLIVRQSQVS